MVSAVGAYSLASARKPSSLKIAKARLPRSGAVAQLFGVELDRHVDADPRQLAALPRRVHVAEQPFAIPLVLHLGRVREQVVERSVLHNQLARALLADARARP